ncbi:MAG: hypothetical protein ACF8QF_08640, partial [Phycisphaerales bacterium]
MPTAHDSSPGAPRRLPRARLAPVGGRGGAGVAAWIAGVALALGACWLAFSALRPLTTGSEASADELGPPRAPILATRDIDARQRNLDALADGANLFAPDRLAWPVVVAAPAPEDDEPEIELATTEQPRIIADASPESPTGLEAIDAIPISDDPPASIRQRMNALTLMGVYGVGDRYTATIRDSTIPKQDGQTRDYRAGDTVGTEQWELLAVDPRTDRVILHRAGHNLELRMYPAIAMAAPTEQTAAPVEAATPEGVRRDLEAAGVDNADIEEFLRLAQSEESLEGETPSADAQAQAPAAPAEPQATRPMPAELSALLRAMAQDTAKRRNDRRDPNRRDPGEGGGGG